MNEQYQIFPTRQDEYQREVREYLAPTVYRIVATGLSVDEARYLVARLTRLAAVHVALAPAAIAA